MAITDLDFTTRLLLSTVGPVLSVAWVWYVVAAARPGAARVVRALPLVPAFFFFSSLFRLDDPRESTLEIIVSHTYLWLVPSKLLCFAMNRGQLVKSYDCGSLTAFTLGMLGMLTIAFEEKPTTGKEETKTRSPHAYKDVRFNVIQLKGKDLVLEIMKLIANILLKIGIIVCMRVGFSRCAESGHFFWRDVCLGWLSYMSSSAVFDGQSLLVLLSTSLKLAPGFKRPFLSQSVQEMWSRRFNLIAGESLRDFIYDPVCEACWVRGSTYYKKGRPSKIRCVIGMILTFAFSGFIHAAVLRYLSQEATFVRCGFFFVACSLVIAVEIAVKYFIQVSDMLKSVAQWVPSWVRMLYTFFTVSYIAHVLFFPEFYEAGLHTVVVDGLLSLLNII